MCETTFENAKINDKVWDIIWKWGKVVRTNSDNELVAHFPLYSYTYNLTFNFEGICFESKNNCRRLFWDELKIIAPEKPKQKVKKWQIMYKRNGFSTCSVTKDHYKSVEHYLSSKIDGYYANFEYLNICEPSMIEEEI